MLKYYPLNDESFLLQMNEIVKGNFSAGACFGISHMLKHTILARKLPIHADRMALLRELNPLALSDELYTYTKSVKKFIAVEKAVLGAERVLKQEEFDSIKELPQTKKMLADLAIIKQSLINDQHLSAEDAEVEIKRRQKQILFSYYTQYRIDQALAASTHKNKVMATILPYMVGVKTYQELDKLDELFPNNLAPLYQDPQIASSIVRTLALPEEEKLIFRGTGIYDETGFAALLKSIRALCQKDPKMPVAIQFQSSSHIITITYDAENNVWVLPDVTPMISHRSNDKVAELIHIMFRPNDTHFLCTTDISVRNEDETKASQFLAPLKDELAYTLKKDDWLLRDKNRWTLLHLAVARDDMNMFKQLINHKENIDYQTVFGASALWLAAEFNRTEMLRLLLAQGANPNLVNTKFESPLFLVCQNENIAAVKLLIAHGADVNALSISDSTAIAEAAKRQNAALATLLLQNGAYIHHRKMSSLPIKINEDEEMTNFPAYNICYASREMTPVSTGEDEQARLLANLKKLDNVNCIMTDGETVLTRSIAFSPECTDYLLSREIDVNMPTEFGALPINRASCLGFAEVVSKLLARGAKVNQPDLSGRTPLFEAVMYGHEDLFELLINAGANVNQADFKGDTPLMTIIKTHKPAYVERLLKAGADPNKGDLLGMTPLHQASKNGEKKIVDLLIKYNADPTVKDINGKSALDYDIANNHKCCIALYNFVREHTARQKLSLFPAINDDSEKALPQDLSQNKPCPP